MTVERSLSYSAALTTPQNDPIYSISPTLHPPLHRRRTARNSIKNGFRNRSISSRPFRITASNHGVSSSLDSVRSNIAFGMEKEETLRRMHTKLRTSIWGLSFRVISQDGRLGMRRMGDWVPRAISLISIICWDSIGFVVLPRRFVTVLIDSR